MYLVYIALSVLALILILLARAARKRNNGKLDMEYFSGGTIIAFALTAFAVLVASMIAASVLYRKVEVRCPPKTLVAIRSTDSVAGTFVLGTGTMGGVLIYNVYVKNSDGSLTPFRIYANPSVRIVEEASLHDVGYWTQTVSMYDLASAPGKWTLTAPDKVTLVGDELRVPIGTIRQSFSIQ